MTTGLKQQIERLSRVVPGENASQKRRAAIGSWAAMVGAMMTPLCLPRCSMKRVLG
jgi:TetR/AcrR family transcriptional repressor of nem operon